MTMPPCATTEDLLQRLHTLEHTVHQLRAAEQIRACVTRYMHLCDHLHAESPLDELAALFTRDAVWEGKGARYAQGFGAYHGRAAIAQMFAGYALTTPPHFAMNAHFLCSEHIAVDADGQGAHASWLMLQTSTFSTQASHLNAAQLTLRMAWEDGQWRIAHFQTENIFSRPVSAWNDSAPLPVPQR